MPSQTVGRVGMSGAAVKERAQREAAKRGLHLRVVRTPEDQALYDACRVNLRLFAETFCAHFLSVAPSRMHEEMYARDAQQVGQRDLRLATAAPRGSAKTTVRGFIKILHDIVYRVEHFIVIFSHRAGLATDRVKQIKEELETNERLVEVYGVQVGEPWNNNEFITRTGVRVLGASPGSQLRGILQKGRRISKILADDFENPEHVVNELQRQKTESRFFSDIMKLGEPGTNVEVIGTILHPQSLLAGLLQNPGFQSFRYQAVVAFASPDALALWQEWRRLFLALENPRRLGDARAYFEAHQDRMLAGSEVLWPERETYYDLMVMRLVEGDTAFYLEKQNEPLGDARYLFDMEDAAFCRVVPEGIVRAGGTLVPWLDIVAVGMAYDPTPDTDDVRGHDFASAPVVAQDRAGYCYILDAYHAQEPSTEAQLEGLIDLLWQWDVGLIGIESNNFASLLVSDLREQIKRRAEKEGVPEFQVQLVPIVNMRNKVARIKTLEPLVKNHWLQFAEALPAQFLGEFANFLPLRTAGQDGGPDATEMAIRTIKSLWTRRDIT